MNQLKTKVKFKIPAEVSRVTSTIESAGFEAFLIGGCVRDLIQEKKPKDWDITTNAKPDDILALFKDAFYENDFGTVGVVNSPVSDETLAVIEVTTYRLEATYSDSRHPDAVTFSTSLIDDLKRRDFTINALAYSVSHETIIDQFGGQDDIQKATIRAVGDPHDRFSEDALRMMRAVRLGTELNFTISHETAAAIVSHAPSIKKIAVERVRDELIRIIGNKNAMQGIVLCQRLGLLAHIAPELELGMGVAQNQAHSFDVWEHNVRTMQHAVDKNWPLTLRLAALLHDVGKPHTRRRSDKKNDWAFHGHDVVGAGVAKQVLTRLRFPKKTSDTVEKLVRWHMFFSDPDKITLSAVRRLMRNVGPENVSDLMRLRMCDRIGTGRPKEQPYRFRKYRAMIDEAKRDPISVTMLAINGTEIMKLLNITSGPKIGNMLHALLEEVLDDPSKNKRDYLERRVQVLMDLPDIELAELAAGGKNKKGAMETAAVKKIREKYWVQ